MNEKQVPLYDDHFHMMEKQGGSFVRALANCYYAADAVNKITLRKAFAHYFDDYKLRFEQYRTALSTARGTGGGE